MWVYRAKITRYCTNYFLHNKEKARILWIKRTRTNKNYFPWKIFRKKTFATLNLKLYVSKKLFRRYTENWTLFLIPNLLCFEDLEFFKWAFKLWWNYDTTSHSPGTHIKINKGPNQPLGGGPDDVEIYATIHNPCRTLDHFYTNLITSGCTVHTISQAEYE